VRLDRLLDLTDRIRHKAAVQVALATPQTTAVGRLAVAGGPLEHRESLLSEPGRLVWGHAVVDRAGEPFAVVRLYGARGEAFRLVAREGAGVAIDQVSDALAGHDAGSADPHPSWITPCLRQIRLAASAAPRHPAARSLARRIVGLARTMAHDRRLTMLAPLDQALQCVLRGIPVGAERDLADVLERPSLESVTAWCRRWPPRDRGFRDPDVVAVVVPVASREASGYIRVHGDAQRHSPSRG
jgi:hypothetical protein